MTVARAGQTVVAVNPDGTNIGSAASPISGNVVTVPLADTSSVNNSVPVTSPGAVATIAQIPSASLPAGLYEIRVTTTVGGTVAASDQMNLTLTAGSTTTRLANGTGTGSSNFGPYQIQLGGSVAIVIATVAAGTAGSIYGASIIATQVA